MIDPVDDKHILTGLDAHFSYQIHQIGTEKQPLIIIDHYLAEADKLIDFALQQNNVLPASGMYPGLRSPVPNAYKNLVLEQLAPLICQTFSLTPDAIKKVDSYYSLVATPVEQLQPAQRIPHFDQPNPDEIAMLHYLCGEQHGGTSFYRHRQSRYEYIDTGRAKDYFGQLDAEVARYGMPQGYIDGDTELFERIVSVPAKFNRLLIYRCSSLHSGDIGADYPFDMDPTTGRFTIASFLHA
ncbi:DUF6445 family protein [Neptunicella sp. SCSIO 80796]|uniref:DUF6445 family protein n=1 Tax=Neptunicella plasticusilytica TaxID=3117012 RepID=UPI003A4D70F2